MTRSVASKNDSNCAPFEGLATTFMTRWSPFPFLRDSRHVDAWLITWEQHRTCSIGMNQREHTAPSVEDCLEKQYLADQTNVIEVDTHMAANRLLGVNHKHCTSAGIRHDLQSPDGQSLYSPVAAFRINSRLYCTSFNAPGW